MKKIPPLKFEGHNILRSRLKTHLSGRGVNIHGKFFSKSIFKVLRHTLQTRNGLGYNAKDDLELEVCLANPNMIATPKCKIPLDICLENPEWLPLVGCSGEGLPLQVCLDFPKLLTSPACEGQFCSSVSFCVLSLFFAFTFSIFFSENLQNTLST